MSKIHLLILTTLLSLCTSCRESDQERVARLVQEWQGKEIIFPEGLVFTRFVKDTVDYQIPESKFKVLVYVDSIAVLVANCSYTNGNRLSPTSIRQLEGTCRSSFSSSRRMTRKYATC